MRRGHQTAFGHCKGRLDPYDILVNPLGSLISFKVATNRLKIICNCLFLHSRTVEEVVSAANSMMAGPIALAIPVKGIFEGGLSHLISSESPVRIFVALSGLNAR